MRCKVCDSDKTQKDFYPNDRTCKECRKEKVKKNRLNNIEYYREYDRKRFQEDPRVRARHKRYQSTDAGKESAQKSKKKWLLLNPVKRGANIIVGNAVRDGKLIKPYVCEECKVDGPIHGHHDDYAKPLDVRWLCSGCHSRWHKENGEGKNAI